MPPVDLPRGQVAGRRPDPDRRRGAAYLSGLVLILVLTQRLAVPLGAAQVPLVIPIMCAAVGWGLLSGYLRWDRSRVLLGLGSLLLLLALTGVAQARGFTVSALSLGLLCAIYVVALVVPDRIGSDAVPAALRTFSTVMALFATVGVVLFALQYVGLPYRDWMAVVVPGPLLQQGFVTAYPISYGSPIFRSNGVIFLEASFYSLFLALGLLVNIHLRRSMLAAGMMACAMVITLSGNGMVVLLPGLAVMLVRAEYRRRLVSLLIPVGMAVAVAAATPLGASFVNRTTEVQRADSSTSLRLVQPYLQLVPPSTGTVQDLLLGHGPGSSDLYYSENLPLEQQYGLLTPFFPKVLYEYGGLGVLLIALFLVQVFFDGGSRHPPWLIGLLLVYALVNAALLQPTLAYLAILFLGLLRPQDPGNLVHGPAPGAHRRVSAVPVTSP